MESVKEVMGFASALEDVAWLCGILVSIWAVVGIVRQIIDATKKPERAVNGKIAQIEGDIAFLKDEDEKIFRCLDNDKARLDGLAQGTALTQSALIELMNHAINGDNVEGLKAARDNLNNYLVKRTVI